MIEIIDNLFDAPYDSELPTLTNNTNSFFGIEDSDSINIYSHEQDIPLGSYVNEVATLTPYDNTLTSNLIHRVEDPFGIYAIKNTYGYNALPKVEDIPQIGLPENFSQADIQEACNTICDTLHWIHLPITLTDSVPNAAYSPGSFVHHAFDDSLYLSPSYAHDCINHIGSTDIVISDLAHEIGHSVAFNVCGDMSTYMNEKTADFISGFVNGKMQIDIDSARKWFECHYDNVGQGGYPVSEERWDTEAAGYYFSHLANSEDLMAALKDPNFIELIKAYQHDKIELLKDIAWQQSPIESYSFTHKLNDYGAKMISVLRDIDSKYHFGPLVTRMVKSYHII